MSQKFQQAAVFASDVDMRAGKVMQGETLADLAFFPIPAGVAFTQKSGAPEVMTFTLTDVVINVPNAAGFGFFKIAETIGRNLFSFAASWDLTWTKDGTGYTVAQDFNFAVGSLEAESTTLVADPEESSLLSVQAVTPNTLTGSLTANEAKPQQLIFNASEIFLNIGGATVVSQDATITLNGTIDLYLWDYPVPGSK